MKSYKNVATNKPVKTEAILTIISILEFLRPEYLNFYFVIIEKFYKNS